MNITMSEIYWLTRLDEFSILFSVLFFTLVIIAIANVIGGLIAMDDAREDKFHNRIDKIRDDESRMCHRFSRAMKIGIAAFVVGMLNSFIPSTKQMAAIIVIPKIANSEIAAEMGDATKEMIELARDWMRNVVANKKETK